ncbi:MAG: hypothetical protein QOC60_91, partial [Frankiaceae bacterium]|nr:hypothetical protein [Frankiaceae bacterium]
LAKRAEQKAQELLDKARRPRA